MLREALGASLMLLGALALINFQKGVSTDVNCIQTVQIVPDRGIPLANFFLIIEFK